MISDDSLNAAVPTGAERTSCSRGAGWRTVLLRGYREPLQADGFTTTPTRDQKIVLITAGSCAIEARSGAGWHGTVYRPGHIGLVAPDEAAHIRWHGTERHHTLQLHVPGTVVTDVCRSLFGSERAPGGALRRLSLVDPVAATTLTALARAARAGAPELYAETAAHFLVSHLLVGGRDERPRPEPRKAVLHRVDDYLAAHLALPVSLGEMAAVAGVSRFQLLRLAKRVWGETPQRRLTRLRMELAQRLLLSKRLSVIEVALECGYGGPAQFATAFRRHTGVPPSRFALAC